MFVYLAKYYSIDRPHEILYYKIGRTDDLYDRNKSLNPLLTPHKTNIIKAWKIGKDSSTVETQAKIHFINHVLLGTEEYFNKIIYNEFDVFMSRYETVDDLDIILTTDTKSDPETLRLYEFASNFNEFKIYIEKRYNQGHILRKESENIYYLTSNKKVIIKKLGVNYKPEKRKLPNNQTQITDSNLLTIREASQIKNWRTEGKDAELFRRVISSEEALLFVYNCIDNRWVAFTSKELLSLVPYEKWDDESLGAKSCKKYTRKCQIAMNKDNLLVGPISSLNKNYKFKLKIDFLLKREFDFVNNKRIDLSSILI